jgi:thioredoxin 1
MGGLLDELGPAYTGRINFFKLDIDQASEIAAEYGVRSIPTLVFFHDGDAVHRVVGLLPLHPLREKLDHLASLGGEDTEASDGADAGE